MIPVQRAYAIERLFPPGVIAFETRTTVPTELLLPAERECVAHAVDKRVREFAAGRVCARAGFAALGFEPTPLLSQTDRAPAWPPGIVGSITHTNGYCVAVVGLEARFAGIGIDAERLGRLSPRLWRFTMRQEELERLQSLDEAPRSRMASVIFSAKEAFYKCQYAMTRAWLGFDDVAVTVADEVWEASVMAASAPIRAVRSSWMGRFSVADDTVVTTIAAERE